LIGLKENALRALLEQGMLVAPMDSAMHEDVMPWMLSRMMHFLEDEDIVGINVREVIEEGFELGR
jgi:hypothetical protein